MPTTTAESPVETESPLSVLFADLDGELATTRRMLERVPNGHDDWRPHEKSRSLGQLATHLAQLPGFGMMMLGTTVAGDVYTFAEYETMFRNSGFASSELHVQAGAPEAVIVSRKGSAGI